MWQYPTTMSMTKKEDVGARENYSGRRKMNRLNNYSGLLIWDQKKRDTKEDQKLFLD